MFDQSKRGRRFGAVMAGLAFVASACGTSATDNASTSDAPDASIAAEQADGPGLPALAGATVAGGNFDTEALAGQDVLVWFWAPW